MAQRTKKKKIPNWLLAIVVATVLVACYFLYTLFGPNTGSFTEGEYLYIRTGSNYEKVKEALQNGRFVSNINSFEKVAYRAGYPEKVKAGKYHIKPGMSNYSIVRMLRSGNQEPVKLVINKLRTRSQFLQLLQKNFEADSSAFLALLNDSSFLQGYQLVPENAMSAFLPNTYELYWNAAPITVLEKIARSYTRFWTDDRVAKAKNKNLTPAQVVSLASIVEEETNKKDEKPTIASVYLNRLSKGMKLQADPTARWAGGDFTIKRVTSKQTSIASPYNTYYTTGLPPGPICTPSLSSIEAVLSAPDNNYLYFCAKEDFSGYHSFAATYDEHMANARRYQAALNARGIK